MRISSRVEYGINALIDIAAASEKGSPITAQQIASKHSFSVKFLEQILSSLRQNKFVYAEKGRLGGYRLLKKPENITLTSIIEILDDSIFGSTEQDIPNSSHEKDFILDEIYSDFNNCLVNYADNITLKELCERDNSHKECDNENGYMYYI